MNTNNTVKTRSEAGFNIVTVKGEVDLSWSSQIRGKILDALSSESKEPVLVELTEVAYIDSSGIAALVEGYQTAKTKQLGFGLVSISSAVKAVLELARLDQVFPIYRDLSEAGN